MSQEKLTAAVHFLLDEHLKGEPVDDSAKARFQAAQSHKDALARVEDETPKAPVAAPQAFVPPVPPTAPSIPQVPSV